MPVLLAFVEETEDVNAMLGIDTDGGREGLSVELYGTELFKDFLYIIEAVEEYSVPLVSKSMDCT